MTTPRITLITVLALSIAGAGIYYHAHNRQPVTLVKSHTAVVSKTAPNIVGYNDCMPRSHSKYNIAGQQQIIATARAMQQEEVLSKGRMSPGLAALDRQYKDLIATYDECSVDSQ